MVGSQVRLRLLPELVVVLALDDLAAYAGDSLDFARALHSRILVGTPAPSPGERSISPLRMNL
jgi:hypothetical protein